MQQLARQALEKLAEYQRLTSWGQFQNAGRAMDQLIAILQRLYQAVPYVP